MSTPTTYVASIVYYIPYNGIYSYNAQDRNLYLYFTLPTSSNIGDYCSNITTLNTFFQGTIPFFRTVTINRNWTTTDSTQLQDLVCDSFASISAFDPNFIGSAAILTVFLTDPSGTSSQVYMASTYAPPWSCTAT